MRIIDTHCHPQFPQYNPDRDEVIRRALDSDIGMICVGTDLVTSKQAIELAEKYEGLYASVGLHPNDNLDEAYHQDVYRELAQHPKVVAIGEIGLDYYRTTEPDKREFQKSRFAQQLELARLVRKPVIIHCRDSIRSPRIGETGRHESETSVHEDMISMLQGMHTSRQTDSYKLSGVIHSFTGTSEQAIRYIEKGYYIGLNGIVTFSKEYEEMVCSIPLSSMLLETDAPYLAPAPYRGKRSEPAYVEIVGNNIASILNKESLEVFSATTKNSKTLFSI